jgi:carbamoyltransferase
MWSRCGPTLARGFPFERIVCVEHHRAHASTADYGYGNSTDEVLVLTCNGGGDGLCATVRIGRQGRLERLHATGDRSIGALYEMVACLMGMVPLEHEHKVMGLAPYAAATGTGSVAADFSRLIRFDPGIPSAGRGGHGTALGSWYVHHQSGHRIFSRGST